jgi:DNA repair protein SbcD/Mre11
MSNFFRILCTGDLHLGRFPAGLPSIRPELSVGRVWSETATYAIENQVDAVILTGDVVDHANRFYEAFSALKTEVERLVAASIPVVAVAGNHDFEVLSRLAESLGSDLFSVLGRGGEWETKTLTNKNGYSLRLVGWSFPRQHITTCPLAGFPSLEEGPLTIGLLHADLDVAASRYAPVARGDLLALPPNLWLLGHQHIPQLISDSGHHILYPGSPQPLRQPESGARGPWLISIAYSGTIEFQQVHLATLRYALLQVDLSGVSDQAEVGPLVSRSMMNELRKLIEEQPSLIKVLFRLELVGRTSAHANMAREAKLIEDQLEISEGIAKASVERAFVRTTPNHDLNLIAGGVGPSAALARLLIDVRSGGEAGFVDRATRAVSTLAGQPAFLPIKGLQGSDEGVIRELVYEQGLLLLEKLQAQSSGGET